MTIKHFADVMPDGRVRACLPGRAEDDGALYVPEGEGRLVLLDAQIKWKGPTSTGVLHWSAEAGLHWIETASLSDIRERKRAEVTTERLRADGDCFTYQGVKIRTADKDMFDLLIANARIAMGEGMPPNWPGGWIGIDGIVFISTREEWKPFFIAMYDAGIANFMHSQMLKAQIEDAATPAQIEAITW